MVELWSQAAYVLAKGGRRPFKETPRSLRVSVLQDLHAKIDHVYDRLPTTMHYSTRNRRVFRCMGQEALFVSFHLLLNHARFVAHQDYLGYSPRSHGMAPYEDDEVEPILNTQKADVVSRCVSSANAIVSILEDLTTTDDIARSHLQAVFAAEAMLSAANVQLWVQHVQAQDDNACVQSQSSIESMVRLLTSWRPQWQVADAWLSTLAALRKLYHMTYTDGLATTTI
jgi:hypothetical protein